MTMTTRKRTQRTQDTSTDSVKVVEPHLVYHDGEQRSGVLTDVPADTFAHWERHGWVTINDKPTPPKEPTSEK